MMGYFKPLRRKIGVAALVVACLFAAGWVRSCIFQDTITIAPSSECDLQVVSISGHLVLAKFDLVLKSGRISKPMGLWMSRKLDDTEGWVYYNAHNHRAYFGVRNRSFVIHREMLDWGVDQISYSYIHTPYRWIVIPLTLFSAWMLLSKPRAGKQTEPTEAPLHA